MDITDLELKVNETNTERFQKLHSKTLGFKFDEIEQEEIKTKQNKYHSDVIFLSKTLYADDILNSTEAEDEGMNTIYSLEYKWFKMASAFENVLKKDGMPTKVNKVYTFDDDLPWTNAIKKEFIGIECVLEKVVTNKYLKGTKQIHKTAAKGLTRLERAKSYFKIDKCRLGLGLMLEAMEYYGMLTIQLRDLEIQVGRAQLEYGKNNNGGKRPSLKSIAPFVQKVIDNYLIKKPKASDTEVFNHITNRLEENEKSKTSENVESTKNDFDKLIDALSTLKEKRSQNDNKTSTTLKVHTLRKWKTRGVIKLRG